MTSRDTAHAAFDDRDLVRLVRHVIVRNAGVAAEVGISDVRLRAPEGTCQSFARPVFDAALSRGLIERAQGGVMAAPQARAFLRRAALGPEEAFSNQHRDLVERDILHKGGRETVRVNLSESPLGSLTRLKDKSGGAFLPADAIAAGERLHADFTRGQLQPRLTMTYEPRLSAKTTGKANGAAELSDTALAARQRVRLAVEAIGPELCGVALDVCCFEKGLETVERERQWPARSAKLLLRAALMALARHYAPPAVSARRSHAWGAEGYRPEMDGAFGVKA